MGVEGVEPHGFCARCSFRYRLRDLKTETENYHETSFFVCPECWDPDQPQSTLGRLHFNDPQPLDNPRPPMGLVVSRSLGGFNPVRGMNLIGSVGQAYGLTS